MSVPMRTSRRASTYGTSRMTTIPALLLDEVAFVPQPLEVRITTEQCA
jgi:hypothetical protein